MREIFLLNKLLLIEVFPKDSLCYTEWITAQCSSAMESQFMRLYVILKLIDATFENADRQMKKTKKKTEEAQHSIPSLRRLQITGH